MLEAESDGADFFLGEDIDLSDETVLRDLEAVIERCVGQRRGVRVSVLAEEQWQTAVERLVPARLRREIRKHFHVLPDPRNGAHLLVGPATLAGLNERSRQMTAEVVYAILKAGEPRLPTMLGRGIADLIATDVARRTRIGFFTNNYPRERRLCADLIEAVQSFHGNEFSSADWLALMKTNPDRFLLALRRTRFCAYWLACAKRDERLAPDLAGARRTAMTERLMDPELGIEDYFARFTRRCLDGYKALDETPTPVEAR